MASLAIPKILGPNERIRAGEGVQVLSNLLLAQKSYALDNGGAYASAVDALDVTIPASANFNAPTVANNAGSVASIVRNTGAYTLIITDAGIVTCSGTCAGVCKGGGSVCN